MLALSVLASLVSLVGVGDAAAEVIQAQVPPRTSYEGAACRQTVLRHEFKSSYGVPYVGTYTPPTNCTFTTTIFNMSVTSQGRQYDRLGLLFFGDTEIWRTSTAMPSQEGIFWSYQKDMTIYSSLLRTEQKVIFDLSNVYSDLYTGAFNITLEALYYNDVYESGLSPPDAIFPISALAAAQDISSVLSLPDGNGTVGIAFPRNVDKAIVSVIATGNGAEEFWYTNVPSEYVDSFPSNPGWLYGYSPFREVQVLIDGVVVGVNWPFPSLFTGGVDPGLWRPVVGIDAYDLPSFEVDVSPWLGVLCDGDEHTFGIKVVGFEGGAEGGVGDVGANWWVTGAVFVWLDEGGNQTTGSTVMASMPDTEFDYNPVLTTDQAGNTTTNSTLYFTLAATRSLSITSTIHTSSGSKNASWTQSMSFTNIQNMTAPAFNQSLSMLSSGSSSSSLIAGLTSTYSYPLNLYSAYVIAEDESTLSSVLALIDRSLTITGLRTLSSYISGMINKETVETRQVGQSQYYWNETIVEGTADDTGVMEQWFSYDGKSGVSGGKGVGEYGRYVKEVDDVLIVDEEGWKSIEVPSVVKLPYVEGEPSV